MDNPYMGTIIAWPGTFAIRNWAYCNGALIAINSNQALYSILGIQFGGDARTTFGLPDLRGRTIVGSSIMGQGPGLIGNYTQGVKSGVEVMTLTLAQLPPHNHTATSAISGSATFIPPTFTASGTLGASASAGSTNTPGSGVGPAQIEPLAGSGDTVNAYGAPDRTTTMPVTVQVTATGGGLNTSGLGVTTTVGITGQGQAFPVLQPYTAISFIIALEGLYPPRN